MADLPLTDLLLGTPPDSGALPHVTPAILADAFAEQGVLLGGSASERRVLRWFAPLSRLDSTYLTETPVSVSELLLAADPEDIPALAEQFPGSYLITQVADEASLEALRPYGSRLLVLRRVSANAHLLLSLQNLFLRMLLWESEMERIVLRHGSLDDLLDASVPFIGNFIFMSDNNFNVIARTSAVEPPDDLHRTIISNGCLTQRTIAEKRFRLPEKTFYARPASELTPFDRVSYPIHLQHTYFGSISMACCAKPDTEGLRDLFRILIRHVRTVCERQWMRQTACDAPSYFFFAKLLRHEALTAEYMAAQMEANRLPAAGHFKVIVFAVDPSIDPDLAHSVAKTASTLNGGRVRCFPHEHEVVALCHGAGMDGELSHQKTLDEVGEKVYEPFGVDCGVSSVFSGLENMDLAYQQAQIALGFRGAIDRESAANEAPLPRGSYFFEDALLYYLVDPTAKDERFMRFSFSTSIVSILWEEDLENDTSYLALLWFYLQSERNATLTAAKLHMHRNTVLYHIDKIQKRFDFDLDMKSARDWLLLNFKAFFSSQSSESLASIFADEGKASAGLGTARGAGGSEGAAASEAASQG